MPYTWSFTANQRITRQKVTFFFFIKNNNGTRRQEQCPCMIDYGIRTYRGNEGSVNNSTLNDFKILHVVDIWTEFLREITGYHKPQVTQRKRAGNVISTTIHPSLKGNVLQPFANRILERIPTLQIIASMQQMVPQMNHLKVGFTKTSIQWQRIEQTQ